MITKIAGVDILWNCQRDTELQKLSDLFRYHVMETCIPCEGYHTVNFITVTTCFIPHGIMNLKWEGNYMNVDFHVYDSPTTDEEIIILSEETWIVHNRKVKKTDCYVYDKGLNGQDLDQHTIDAVLIILHAVMAMNHRYVLHAASVTINDEAFVFLGESGLGKSTLCASLLEQGADYMGDDIVFLYINNKQLMIGGLLFDGKLYPNTKSQIKSSYDLIKRYSCRGVLRAPLNSIYCINRTGKEISTLKRRFSYETMLSLMRASNNIRMQYDSDVWLDICQQTAETIPTYILNYGSIGSVSIPLLTDRNIFQDGH